MNKNVDLAKIVLDEALARGVSQSKALNVFTLAYGRHKEVHGSYKGLVKTEYEDKMAERYQFCFEQAMIYVKAQEELTLQLEQVE